MVAFLLICILVIFVWRLVIFLKHNPEENQHLGRMIRGFLTR
jgi:hypothetical protein